MRMLEKHGYNVTVANDGKEVLTALGRDRFDVVLMDVQMPDMDGFEATAEIRKKETAAGAPHQAIVAMTAHAIIGTVNAASAQAWMVTFPSLSA